MTYQPYPTSGTTNDLSQPPAQPRSIQNAIKLMYAGAALSAIGFIVGLFSISALKTALANSNKTAAKPLTVTQLHTAENFGVATIIFIGIVGIVLWLWMARANGQGKSWARIVAAVFFALSTLSLLRTVFGPNAIESRIFGILGWLVGLAATVFLWQKDSSEFFARSSSRRQ